MLDSLFADEELAAIFSEPRYVAEMLAVEAALATVEARLGVIPAESGKVIAERVASFRPDLDLIRSRLADDGVPVIELVRQLREHVGGAAADDVHFGATTQDIMDTALVLQMRAALAAVEKTLDRAIDNLAAMARRYRESVMPGRTHSQQAVPIPFGLKAAGWLAPLLRHRTRLGRDQAAAAGRAAGRGRRNAGATRGARRGRGRGAGGRAGPVDAAAAVAHAARHAGGSGGLAVAGQREPGQDGAGRHPPGADRDRRGARDGRGRARRVEHHAAEGQPGHERADRRGGAHQRGAAGHDAPGVDPGARARHERLADGVVDASRRCSS